MIDARVANSPLGTRGNRPNLHSPLSREEELLVREVAPCLLIPLHITRWLGKPGDTGRDVGWMEKKVHERKVRQPQGALLSGGHIDGYWGMRLGARADLPVTEVPEELGRLGGRPVFSVTPAPRPGGGQGSSGHIGPFSRSCLASLHSPATARGVQVSHQSLSAQPGHWIPLGAFDLCPWHPHRPMAKHSSTLASVS